MKTIEEFATEIAEKQDYGFMEEPVYDTAIATAAFLQRWIPVEESVPEDHPELFLKPNLTRTVLVKRKWDDTGEIVIELNERFMPTPKHGFLWNYVYEGSKIIEWRPIEYK